MTRISVIVPHYQQENLLALCLERLEAQTLPRSDYEVVVVENSDGPMSSKIQEGYPGVRFLQESKPGSYAARNHGIRRTTAPILAFTDSDCRPAPDWLERALLLFESHPDVDLIGGNIEMFFREENRPGLIELYDSVNYLHQELYVSLGFAVCANVIIKRGLFETHGLFDDTLKSGGDLEFGQRMTNAGRRIAFGVDVTVAHPARYRWNDFVTLHRRLYGGRWTINRKGTARTIFPVNPLGISRTVSQAWRQVMTEKKLKTWRQRWLVFLMHQLVTLIELREYLRLRSGMEVERR